MSDHEACVECDKFEEWHTRPDWQTQLYNRYQRKVFGICLYFLKDREEAKDATQDVFIKAFRAWGEFEWKCDPLTWIGAIAKHDCFSRRLRRRRQQDRQAELVHEAAPDCGEGPQELVLRRIRLEKALPEVRGRLKEILRLAMDGLNHREIAVRMGVSRVAITRSLTRFRKRLAAEPAAGRRRPAVRLGTAARPGNQVPPRVAGVPAVAHLAAPEWVPARREMIDPGFANRERIIEVNGVSAETAAIAA